MSELEQLELRQELGRGPLGASYAALYRGQPVVAKVLTGKFNGYPELLQGVLDDVRAWVGFEHPSAVAPLEIGTYRDRSVILWQHARGAKTLEAVLAERGPFDPMDALFVIRDVALLLAAVHQGDAPVGDVRASKVYFDGRTTRLADLGLARASCLAQGFGREGLHFGHPAYLAPEVNQAELKDPTPQTDVYALGILYYELVTGKPPFEGDPIMVLHDQLETPLPRPPSLREHPQLLEFLQNLTAKVPAKRLRNGLQVVQELYRAVGKEPPAPEELQATATACWKSRDHKLQEWSTERIRTLPGGPNVARAVTGRLPRMLLESDEPQQPVEEGVQVEGKLGRGPVGTTYEGKLKDYSGDVVVKVLSQRFDQHDGLTELVLGDFRRAEGLAGPGIVGLLRLASVSGRHLCVMERERGGTLRRFLAQHQRLPVLPLLERVREILEALAAGQRRGLAHGDLRPEKVFISAEGKARLCDYGLARAACLGAGYAAFGMPFGHPEYLAPEVLQEGLKEPTLQSDLYALGILLFECIAGGVPFRGETPRDTLRLHLRAGLPQFPPSFKVPPAAYDFVARLTSKDPDRRPATIEEVLAKVDLCAKQVRLLEAEGSSGWSGAKIDEARPVGPKDWPQDGYESEELIPKSPLDFG
ncbi:MAG: serine/threonine-protein kinase [Planctomycetota bacterium]